MHFIWRYTEDIEDANINTDFSLLAKNLLLFINLPIFTNYCTWLKIMEKTCTYFVDDFFSNSTDCLGAKAPSVHEYVGHARSARVVILA